MILPLLGLLSIVLAMVYMFRAIFEDIERARWVWMGVAFTWLVHSLLVLVLHFVTGGV